MENDYENPNATFYFIVPDPEHKKPTDYVSGLFRIDVTLKPRPTNSPFRSRTNTPSNSPPPTTVTTLCTSSKIRYILIVHYYLYTAESGKPHMV